MNAVDVNEVPLIMEFGEDRIGLGDSDRQRARHFVDALRELLPVLMPMRSSIQVDQALKCFASQYCRGGCTITLFKFLTFSCSLKL